MASSSTSSSEKPRRINWVDLPYDLTANITHRLGAIEILENAQKVCTYWYKICKDPAMWRVIEINSHPKFVCKGRNEWLKMINRETRKKLEMMCMKAIDRSQGQLVDISIVFLVDTVEVIQYICERSSQLRRLQLVECAPYFCWVILRAAFEKRFPLLEELHFYNTRITGHTIETIGQSCPRLKSFKFDGNNQRYRLDVEDINVIAENMPGLRHLSVFGKMSNASLKAILDKLAHLESLDLSQCKFKPNRDLLAKCLSHSVDLKNPHNDLEAKLRQHMFWGRNCYAAWRQSCGCVYSNSDESRAGV